MPKTIPKQTLTKHAKSLRRKATQAERTLWRHLRTKKMDGTKFRRRQPIENYIVDFVSFEKRLVIELDGGQHAQHKEKEKDIQRDRFMVENGFKVLRFWNNEVLSNIDGVLEVIRMECLK